MHAGRRGEFSSLLLAGGVAAAAVAGGLLLDDGVQLGEQARRALPLRTGPLVCLALPYPTYRTTCVVNGTADDLQSTAKSLHAGDAEAALSTGGGSGRKLGRDWDASVLHHMIPSYTTLKIAC